MCDIFQEGLFEPFGRQWPSKGWKTEKIKFSTSGPQDPQMSHPSGETHVSHVPWWFRGVSVGFRKFQLFDPRCPLLALLTAPFSLLEGVGCVTCLRV